MISIIGLNKLNGIKPFIRIYINVHISQLKYSKMSWTKYWWLFMYPAIKVKPNYFEHMLIIKKIMYWKLMK